MNTSAHSLDITLDPADNQRLANLCGQFDEHLRLIERRMGVEINNRGNNFRIIGKKKSVEETEEVLRELYTESDKNTLSPEIVNLHLHDTATVQLVTPKKLRSGEEIIIQTKRG
ncbi:MAG: phosphate starvation-inducible protein PhoH, partial [Gammaproteobacteria bacterium]|nr:phosphate starvation-inducible protein PhoH [Gammaproteobacteria bacterium]